MNSAYTNSARCHIGTCRPSKRELTVYGTSRPRGFDKNAMALLDQSRDSWPSMAPIGHGELTKMQKHLEIKNKNKNENKRQNETNVSVLLLHFRFCFCFCFSMSFLFSFSLLFLFSFSFLLLLLFSFLFFFYFLVFIFKFYYGTSRPPYTYVRASFLILTGLRLKALALLFSCKICQIFWTPFL